MQRECFRELRGASPGANADAEPLIVAVSVRDKRGGIAVCAELGDAADRSTERRVCADASREIGAMHASSSQ